MNRKLFLLIPLFVALILVVLFFSPKRDAGGTRPLVGAIIAESGSVGYIGKPEARILRALHKKLKRELGEEPFELQIHDSLGDPDKARVIFQQLVSDPRTKAVIGPSTSAESILVAKLAEKDHIPLLSLAVSKLILMDNLERQSLRKWVYRYAQSDELGAERLLRAMVSLGLRKVCLLYSDDPFGKSGANAFRESLKGTPGISIIYDSSFRPNLDRPEPVAAACPEAADAILIWGLKPGPELLVQALHRARHKANIFLSHGNASPAFLASAGPSSEGAIVVGSRVLSSGLDKTNLADKVILDFKEFWQSNNLEGEPSHFGGHARDAYAMLAQLFLEKKATSREAIREGLETIGSFNGVTGTFQFTPTDHAGLTIDSLETYEIVSGQFVKWKR